MLFAINATNLVLAPLDQFSLVKCLLVHRSACGPVISSGYASVTSTSSASVEMRTKDDVATVCVATSSDFLLLTSSKCNDDLGIIAGVSSTSGSTSEVIVILVHGIGTIIKGGFSTVTVIANVLSGPPKNHVTLPAGAFDLLTLALGRGCSFGGGGVTIDRIVGATAFSDGPINGSLDYGFTVNSVSVGSTKLLVSSAVAKLDKVNTLGIIAGISSMSGSSSKDIVIMLDIGAIIGGVVAVIANSLLVTAGNNGLMSAGTFKTNSWSSTLAITGGSTTKGSIANIYDSPVSQVVASFMFYTLLIDLTLINVY